MKVVTLPSIYPPHTHATNGLGGGGAAGNGSEGLASSGCQCSALTLHGDRDDTRKDEGASEFRGLDLD